MGTNELPSCSGCDALASLGWVLANRFGRPLQLASIDENGLPTGLIGEPKLRDSRVLLVNDVVTTGDGLEQLGALVRDRGGVVAGASWFASRAEVDVDEKLGLPDRSFAARDGSRHATCRPSEAMARRTLELPAATSPRGAGRAR